MFIRRLIMYGLISLLLLLGVPQDRLLLTPSQILANSYQYNLLTWEVVHFPQKWVHRLWAALPFTGSLDDREAINEYFRLVDEVRRGRLNVQAAAVLSREEGSTTLSDLRAHLAALQRHQKMLRPHVEEALEGAIGAVLAMEGIPLGLGPIKFPPVDFTFVPQPTVLITSPRDRIMRMEDSLLQAGIPAAERDALEDRLFQEQNLAALVMDTGGVATYPAVVSPTADLHWALITASHEWFHHFFFFKPLGQHFYGSSEMMTLNESVAAMLGEAVGDRAFELVTGKKVTRVSQESQVAQQEPGDFDFRREMRKTRLRTDELLGNGMVEEAERYMEERRQLMVENGYYIRKLNQAYFAFLGTYARSPESVSPIDAQLLELRGSVSSLGLFVDLVASVSTYDQFLAMLVSEA